MLESYQTQWKIRSIGGTKIINYSVLNIFFVSGIAIKSWWILITSWGFLFDSSFSQAISFFFLSLCAFFFWSLILISSFLCSAFATLGADCCWKSVNLDLTFSSDFSNALISLFRDLIIEFWSLILISYIWIWSFWSILVDLKVSFNFSLSNLIVSLIMFFYWAVSIQSPFRGEPLPMEENCLQDSELEIWMLLLIL